ncbi:MAG: hypothetical protein PHD70_09995 [Anaerostipes sp.]|nr:hypothetical protein [Anaerostipes sp.]MDD3746787.1 hypothetical protein [Anaerostipes sp.]
MNKTLCLMKGLLTSFFLKEDEHEILDYFCDDIYICGLMNDEIIHNKDELCQYIKHSPRQKLEKLCFSGGGYFG